MIFRFGFLLWLITSCTYSQIKPGVYELYFYEGSEEGLTIDSLFNDERCTYTSYSLNGECVLISIISTWTYKDGILYYSSQVAKERKNCTDDFQENNLEDISYRITESGENSFEGEMILEPVNDVLINQSPYSDHKVKWIKIRAL